MVIDVTTEEEHAATITREVTLKMEAAGFLKHRYPSTKPHGITFLKSYSCT